MTVLLSKTVVKQFEYLALELEVSKSVHVYVAGCYRTPSAENGAQLLSQFNSKELLALDDFYLNWLQPVSYDLKSYCNSLNVFQLVGSATRPNPKKSRKCLPVRSHANKHSSYILNSLCVFS